MGGLGNQLFQLAAGIYLSEECGRNVKFSADWFDASRQRLLEGVPRDLMIAELINPNEWSELAPESLRRHYELSRSLQNYWVTETDPSDNTLERVTPNTEFLVGYFQKIRYVDAVKNHLLERIQRSPSFQSLIPRQLESRVAVHMRFGDYAENPVTRQFHGLTDTSYFIDAAKILMTEIDSDELVIVSDEPQRARKEFNNQTVTNVKIYSQGTSELEDLAILSNSAGIVMANSSFSWWAAWISNAVMSPQVIMPTPWFSQKSIAESNLQSNSWKLLPRKLVI